MSGRELGEARARKGVSLEEASQRTRIPPRYLEALERGDHSIFPPGPFLKGYSNQYRTWLGLPVLAESGAGARLEAGETQGRIERPDQPRDPGLGAGRDRQPGRDRKGRRDAEKAALPVGWGRRVALGALALVALLLALRLGSALVPESETALGVAPDQVVELRPVERVKVRIIADDRIIYDGDLVPRGPEAPPPRARACDGDCIFSAHDRLEVAVSNLALVTVVYDGEILKPLGAQSRPRRLVFIDDQTGS